MRRINFTKYDAAGNTFLVVEQGAKAVDRRLYRRIAQELCDPGRGVGADGLLLMRPSSRADFALDIFNADGSWAERSGNGLRAAIAHALCERAGKTNWTIACQRECVAAKIISYSPQQTVIQSEIGLPEFFEPEYTGTTLKISQAPQLTALRKTYRYMRVSIGNPHIVIFVRSIPKNWIEIGRNISKSARLRNGANIEFVRPVGPSKIEVRVFERGVGPTESSGTGAAAALVALRTVGKVNKRAVVDFGLQKLSVSWTAEMVTVTGPVIRRFAGEMTL